MEAPAVYNSLTMETAHDITAALYKAFVDWIDRGPKTTRTYITNFRQFLTWLKFKGIARPTRQDIINYRYWLAHEHEAIRANSTAPGGWSFKTDAAGNPLRIVCRPNTIAQYLRSIGQFFSWTANNGLYPDIAANIHPPKVTHDTHRKEALTAADVLRIEASIITQAATRTEAAKGAAKDTAGRKQRSEEQGKRLLAIYSLAVTAGLRTIEISRANIKDLEIKGGQAWLFIYGKGRTEPDQKKALAPEIADLIADYLKSRADRPTAQSPLFVATGNRANGKRLAPTTISTLLKAAMIEAGYNSEKITAHSLRHTAGTAVQELTGNIYETQKYMRHSNPVTTEIYVHTETDRQEALIAQRLYNFYHESTLMAAK